MRAFPRVLPVGDSAACVELSDTLDLEANARVRALDLALAGVAGISETVPTLRSLLVVYDRGVFNLARLREAVLSRLAKKAEERRGRLHRVPTVYGGEGGPDLDEAARKLGLESQQLVAAHAGREFVALMVGFTPGFAYLGLLDPTLELPRRPTPRPRVPKGTVGIAGRMTGIYPSASPGGWSLLGRTSLHLFDPIQGALIQAGDRVRFEPVRDLEGDSESSRPARVHPSPFAEVIDPGLLTTIQDAGRFGHRRSGVAWAGPMDARAHREANGALGNFADAPALELTLRGPTLRFLAPVHFSLGGADLGAHLDRSDLGTWRVPVGEAVLARPGNVLSFSEPVWGCRASLAVEGGLDVPEVLGSASTDLLGGFGGLEGRALRPGDRLGRRPAAGGPPRRVPRPSPPRAVTLRVVLGPQEFPQETVAALLSQSFLVSPLSDRVGCRLEGPRLAYPGEIVSDGMLPGCIEVPRDGQPVVLMADAPTTGGYPKIATVVSEDLSLLAQLVPGVSSVRFHAVAPDE